MECDHPHGTEQEMNELATSLHRLLEEQLAAGRAGDLSRMERLGEQANAVVARIVRQGGDLGLRQGDLKRSYHELILTLRAEQADVQGKLKQLRRVKRVVGAYRRDR